MTEVNSPTFTADLGYAGNGTTSYLNTGWDPSNNRTVSSLDSTCFGFYANGGTDAANDSSVAIGSLDATAGTFIRPWLLSSNGHSARVNQNSTTAFSGTVSSHMGMIAADRSTSNLVTEYRQGAANGTFTMASNNYSTQDFFIGGANNNGTPSLFMDLRFALVFHGQSLTADQHAAMYAAVRRYLIPMGAQ